MSEVRVGCIRCKRTKRTEDVAKVAKKAIEEILDETFDFLRNSAATQGVQIPDEFKEKIFKWAAKNELIEAPVATVPQNPPDAEPRLTRKMRKTNKKD